MSTTATDISGLVPIDEVARRFGLRASTIRYYEERGLLDPVARHSGRRWYGQAELRRLAIIRYWQESALMSLEDIGEMLAGAAGSGEWRKMVDEQLRSLSYRIGQMEAAREFLEHVASHHDIAPDGCAHYEALIWERRALGPASIRPHSG
jgi:MerR family copper efflux transcriptional regulator